MDLMHPRRSNYLGSNSLRLIFSLAKRTRPLVLISATLFSVSACNVYQSSGRKSFESKIPESQTSSQSLTTTQMKESRNLCWSQPADEALWPVETHQKLEVTFIDGQNIQVCFIESSDDQSKKFSSDSIDNSELDSLSLTQ